MSRANLFDRWAPGYEASVRRSAARGDFPFAGYDEVIRAIAASAEPGMTVLDMGTGTGTLARQLADRGCRVTGADFSAAMLERARANVPEARFVEADLAAPWPGALDGPFDLVVSAYVLHEFELDGKIAILREAARRLAPAGAIAVGDVGFRDRAAHDAAKRRWGDSWDHDEHYWIADEVLGAARPAGLGGRWTTVSACAGAAVLSRAP